MKRWSKIIAAVVFLGMVGSAAPAFAAGQGMSLDQKKTVLELRVKEGRITQAQADEILKAIETNRLSCTGDGAAAIGQKYGVSFGQGQGKGQGAGQQAGRGMRNGAATK